MEIIIDTREKDRAIKKILRTFDSKGIVYETSKLVVGDYMSLDNARRVVDRKQNLSEVYTNLCHEGKKGSSFDKCARFIKELERAKKLRIGVYFLIEHGSGMTCLDDVKSWENPRLNETPYAWDGKQMHRRMSLLLNDYPNIRFRFCEKSETGDKIIELLGGDRS